MRIDKTYSELWALVDNHQEKEVREIAKMAINALQKLQKENVRLLAKNNRLIERI